MGGTSVPRGEDGSQTWMGAGRLICLPSIEGLRASGEARPLGDTVLGGAAGAGDARHTGGGAQPPCGATGSGELCPGETTRPLEAAWPGSALLLLPPAATCCLAEGSER